MSRSLAACVAIALIVAATSAPALAQNPVQVSHARAGANCPRCNLFQADLANLDLKGRNFGGARLRQSDMSAAVMTHTNFGGADLRDVNGYAGVFTGANFAGANMANASFVGAYLQGANFRGAHLEGVNFSGAEMDHAVGLTPGQLAGACGDASTRAPRGMSLRPCG